MGADLILSVLPRFVRTDERREVFAAMLRDCDEAALLAAYEDSNGTVADETKENMIEVFLYAFDESSCGQRDVADIRIPGADYEIAVTGGLSYGDAPTEAMAYFEALVALPDQFWSQFEKWAKDDIRVVS